MLERSAVPQSHYWCIRRARACNSARAQRTAAAARSGCPPSEGRSIWVLGRLGPAQVVSLNVPVPAGSESISQPSWSRRPKGAADQQSAHYRFAPAVVLFNSGMRTSSTTCRAKSASSGS